MTVRGGPIRCRGRSSSSRRRTPSRWKAPIPCPKPRSTDSSSRSSWPSGPGGARAHPRAHVRTGGSGGRGRDARGRHPGAAAATRRWWQPPPSSTPSRIVLGTQPEGPALSRAGPTVRALRGRPSRRPGHSPRGQGPRPAWPAVSTRTMADVESVLVPARRHRIALNFEGQSDPLNPMHFSTPQAPQGATPMTP